MEDLNEIVLGLHKKNKKLKSTLSQLPLPEGRGL